MKLNFAGYEVEIKAKREYHSRANKDDVMNLLNSISIWALEAAEHNRSRGANASAEHCDQVSEEIYEALKAAGCYKNC